MDKIKVPLFNPIVTEEMKKSLIRTLENDFFVLGKTVKSFEDSFSQYIGTKYAVSTSSGTNALHLCLESFGIKGKEVITTPATFIATSNSIIHAGGKPVFVDINYGTNTIDPNKIEEAITDKTAGILPVHLYGFPCQMDKINKIAEKHGIFVLEDACQAHGSEFMNKKIGNIGTAGCFSFYSTKNITVCGDGGMVTTNNASLYEMVSKLRNCGRKEQYIHDVIGYTSRLNSINAAIGLEQLKLLEMWNSRKVEIANLYRESLDGVGDLMLPPTITEGKIAYHLYVIKTKQRDKLKSYLEKKGIGCGVYYPIPIHLQPAYSQYRFRVGDFPKAELLCERNLAIPISPQMTNEDVEYVIANIKHFFKNEL